MPITDASVAALAAGCAQRRASVLSNMLQYWDVNSDERQFCCVELVKQLMSTRNFRRKKYIRWRSFSYTEESLLPLNSQRGRCWVCARAAAALLDLESTRPALASSSYCVPVVYNLHLTLRLEFKAALRLQRSARASTSGSIPRGGCRCARRAQDRSLLYLPPHA